MMKPFDVALTHLGQQEIRDRKALMQFMKQFNIIVNPAVTPWCAGFVNACERAGGNPGNGSLSSQSFKTYGTKVLSKDAQKGDIIVFNWGDPNHGHVTFLDHFKDDGTTLVCLGGNQNDEVNYKTYPRASIVAIRRYTA